MVTILYILIVFSMFTQSIFPEEWRPAYYADTSAKQRPQFVHAIKEVPKLLLTGNERVLDVGCGDGTTSAYIAQQWLPHGTLHGVDASESMINAANKHHSSNVTFERSSLLHYNPTQLYDALVCFWVLFLFDDYDIALERVVSFLKPGGKALICHIIDPGTPFFQLFKKHIAPHDMPIKLPTLATVISAIKKAPVAIDHLEVKYNYDRYSSAEELITAMKKIPFFNLLPHDREAIFHQELLEKYAPREDESVYDFSQVVCMILEKR